MRRGGFTRRRKIPKAVKCRVVMQTPICPSALRQYSPHLRPRSPPGLALVPKGTPIGAAMSESTRGSIRCAGTPSRRIICGPGESVCCEFRVRWCWSTRTNSCGRWWARWGRWRRRRGSDPSPVPRPLEKARGAVHPLPTEREKSGSRARVRAPQEKVLSFSEGRRWPATGALSSRRGPDEGSPL